MFYRKLRLKNVLSFFTSISQYFILLLDIDIYVIIKTILKEFFIIKKRKRSLMEIIPRYLKMLKNNKGFLMIDAIVTVVIVSVALVTLSYLYTQGTKASVMAASSERAMEIAAQRIEFLKKGAGEKYTADQGLAALLTVANGEKVVKLPGENIEYIAECSALQVYSDSTDFGQDKLYKIAVTVSWMDTTSESVRLATYVAVE